MQTWRNVYLHGRLEYICQFRNNHASICGRKQQFFFFSGNINPGLTLIASIKHSSTGTFYKLLVKIICLAGLWGTNQFHFSCDSFVQSWNFLLLLPTSVIWPNVVHRYFCWIGKDGALCRDIYERFDKRHAFYCNRTKSYALAFLSPFVALSKSIRVTNVQTFFLT